MAEINFHQLLINALNGVNAHVNPLNTLEDLTVEIAGKEITNSPYTIWQILKHVNYWQVRFISYIKDNFIESPITAEEGWNFPSSPLNEKELKNEVNEFIKSINVVMNLNEQELKSKAQNYKTGYDVLQAMASHISYHFGEIVLLRRIIGNWPPPSGGDTW
jgi:hypothetical protein